MPMAATAETDTTAMTFAAGQLAHCVLRVLSSKESVAHDADDSSGLRSIDGSLCFGPVVMEVWSDDKSANVLEAACRSLSRDVSFLCRLRGLDGPARPL